MVDIHCHIIPQVDDGAYDLDAAVEMVAIARRSGVTQIIATPHFYGVEASLEKLPEIYRQFDRLRRAAAGIPVRLHCGAEVLCVPQTLELARRGKLPTLGKTPYVLAEFYFDAPVSFMEEMLGELRRLGYRPVVAHPERYNAVQRDPDVAGRWFSRGYGIQLNKGSLLGVFGWQAEETARLLLRRGNAHVIASDAHSPKSRTTDLGKVWDWCRDHLGRSYANILLEENPRRIAAGLELLQTE